MPRRPELPDIADGPTLDAVTAINALAGIFADLSKPIDHERVRLILTNHAADEDTAGRPHVAAALRTFAAEYSPVGETTWAKVRADLLAYAAEIRAAGL